MNSKMEKLAALNAKATAASPARERLTALFDPDTFVEIDTYVMAGGCGVIAGYGLVEGSTVYAYAQDVTSDSGAMNVAHANKIRKIYDLALKNGCPVVSVYDSKGAKISEGNAMLAAYGQILQAANNLSGVVPQIAVVVGTCSGASALLAASADFVIASKDGEIFLSAEKCDCCDAGSAAYAAENGLVHILADDEAAAVKETRKLLSVLPLNNLAAAPLYEYVEPAAASEGADAKAVIAAIADGGSVTEICAAYAPAVITAFGTVAGSCVGFVATDKAADALNSAACEKAAHFIKVCDAFSIPVVSLIDTDGFKRTACPSMIKAGAKLANVYAEATCAKVNVVTGNAIGAAYIALAGSNANADVTFAWPNAMISALPAETAVEFSMVDRLAGAEDPKAARAALEAEYADTTASAFAAAEGGYITNVIAPAETRAQVITALDMLSGKRVSKLPKKHNTL